MNATGKAAIIKSMKDVKPSVEKYASGGSIPFSGIRDFTSNELAGVNAFLGRAPQPTAIATQRITPPLAQQGAQVPMGGGINPFRGPRPQQAPQPAPQAQAPQQPAPQAPGGFVGPPSDGQAIPPQYAAQGAAPGPSGGTFSVMGGAMPARQPTSYDNSAMRGLIAGLVARANRPLSTKQQFGQFLTEAKGNRAAQATLGQLLPYQQALDTGAMNARSGMEQTQERNRGALDIARMQGENQLAGIDRTAQGYLGTERLRGENAMQVAGLQGQGAMERAQLAAQLKGSDKLMSILMDPHADPEQQQQAWRVLAAMRSNPSQENVQAMKMHQAELEGMSPEDLQEFERIFPHHAKKLAEYRAMFNQPQVEGHAMGGLVGTNDLGRMPNRGPGTGMYTALGGAFADGGEIEDMGALIAEGSYRGPGSSVALQGSDQSPEMMNLVAGMGDRGIDHSQVRYNPSMGNSFSSANIDPATGRPRKGPSPYAAAPRYDANSYYSQYGRQDGFSGGHYADGGAIDVSGHKLEGPGTGTSDSIPAVIDGERPAALSTGEFVIPSHIVKRLGTKFFDDLIKKHGEEDGR